jgi:hypothetical protein
MIRFSKKHLRNPNKQPDIPDDLRLHHHRFENFISGTCIVVILKKSACNWNNLEKRVLGYVKYQSALKITVLHTGIRSS